MKQQTFGRYTLERRLAVGGMGEVLLAHATDGGPQVVLKRALPHLVDNAELRDQLLGEARIAAQLNHPNIVLLRELGDVEGQWFLVMDFVHGRDLRRVLEAARGAVPVEVACRIVLDAARALAYAHQATDAQGRSLKVVHCDVSPHNLLVGFDGVTRLIDFGVARAAKSAHEDALVGKFPYLSPEQAAEDGLDHRSDQFSLGIVFWELLTGKRLFQADEDALTLQRVLECQVPAPSSLAPVPKRLERLVLRMLEKSEDARWPDCAAVVQQLEDALVELQLDASAAAVGAFLKRLFPGADAEATPLPPPSSPRPERTASERVRDEKAVEAWAQLGAAERSTLAQLTVFDEPATLEAMEAVVDLSAIDGAPWVLDVVQAVTERGLLEAKPLPDAPETLVFSMPAIVRQFARLYLQQLGEAVGGRAMERVERLRGR